MGGVGEICAQKSRGPRKVKVELEHKVITGSFHGTPGLNDLFSVKDGGKLRRVAVE